MKKMLQCLALLALVVACGPEAFAQNNARQRMSREQLAEVQARHIADEMAMDDATSRKFIPVFCQYQQEIWALGPRAERPRSPQTAAQTDAAAEQALKERFERSQQILAIRQKYYAAYGEFLTQRQIQRVYELEHQMMKRLAGRGKGRSPRP